MEFKDRLSSYRNELRIKTKSEMAEKIGIKINLYSMLESGQRKPSQDVLDKLFLLSNRPEEYWLYGVDNEKDYLESRVEFKMIRRTVNQLIELGLLKDENFSNEVQDVLVAALKSDIKHLIKKKQE